ncbi:MAG: leucine-rich repeat domain-containing protein [Bacteroidia bacterium]
MKKNYLLFTFLAFLLQLTNVAAQSPKLTFKQLTDEVYYASIHEAMQRPADVRRLNVNLTGATKLPAELQNFPNLQMIYLTGNTRKLNWVTALPELQKLKNLEYIYFQDSGLSTIPPQVFTLAQLKGLAVINSGLSKLPADIAKLSKLEYLILINNRIPALPAEVSGLKNLKVLYLDGNNISAFPPQMANLKKLEELSIAENPINNEEIKKIRKYYPNTKIIESYELPEVMPAE